MPDRHQISEGLLELRAEYYGPDLHTPDVSAPNTALSKIFDDSSVEYIDTTERLRAAGRKNDIFYLQDNYLNSFRHRALADCLRQAEFLE